MTEADVKRIAEKVVAGALRSCCDQEGDFTAVCTKVADALDPPEPDPLPCPFCQKKPKVESGYVTCQTEGCAVRTLWIGEERWNRRAEVTQ